MSAIFISYRREDTAGNAGRIYDRLVDRFGRAGVYRDVDSGQPGEDFLQTIRDRVAGSRAVLALIGPNWLKATDETGGWRLASENDLVRVEIATALERGIRVIPVLLQGAKIPRAGDLPSALSKLAHRNAVEIRDAYFEQDVSQLIETLSPRWFQPRWLRVLGRPALLGMASVLLMAAFGGVYLSQMALTAEQARAMLTKMDIPYTPESFVRSAELKDSKAVELFLKAGLDANAANRRGVTALQWAASRGDLPMMKTLLKSGATIEGALRWAAAAGQLDALNLLVSRKPTQEALDGALISGAGQPDAVRVLLDRGADPKASDKDGVTALMEAASKAKPESMKLLIANGANVHAQMTSVWRRGATPLYLAANSANEDIAIEAVKLLLEQGAAVDVRAGDFNSSEGWTPLLMALQNERWKTARFLIERGADVNAQGVAGSVDDERLGIGLAPLMQACRKGEVDTSLALLDKGANVELRSPSGRTAIMFAAESGSLRLVEALLSRGATVNHADKKGWTPLMYASSADVAEALLRNRADVSARAKRGATVLMIAAQTMDPKTIHLLLREGANPDAVNDDGWTALMLAADMGNDDNAQALVDAGASKSAKNHAGETALDIARKKGSKAVVETLLAPARTVKARGHQ